MLRSRPSFITVSEIKANKKVLEDLIPLESLSPGAMSGISGKKRKSKISQRKSNEEIIQ